VAAAGAAVVLGGAAFGVAAAQTPTPATPTRPAGAAQVAPDQREEQFLTALASKLGVTVDRLRQAVDETRQSLGLPDRGGFGGPGGHGGPGGPGGPGGFGRGGPSFTAAAQAMGISVDQLRQELPGKTLADVARAHNVDPNAVASALKTAAASRIDQDVTAGRLTADQASQAKQQANTRIDQQMTQQQPTGGPGRPAGQPGSPRATPPATATPRP
jgi:hypothetical protein